MAAVNVGGSGGDRVLAFEPTVYACAAGQCWGTLSASGLTPNEHVVILRGGDHPLEFAEVTADVKGNIAPGTRGAWMIVVANVTWSSSSAASRARVGTGWS